MRESDLIEWIRQQTRLDPSAVPVGPGDDCAVIRSPGGPLLVTTDQVLDGVHVRLAECGPAAAGRKAMARNLSDIAAMAGEPVAAVATVCLPKGLPESDAREIYRGMADIGQAFDCPIAGGDVAFWEGALAIGVTVLGRPAGAEPVLRSGARVGDAVCVTGRLGAAWRTGRDLTFTPRIAEGRALLEYGPTAMIDLSDGLGTDLWHVCRASGVGAVVRAADLPLADEADVAAAIGDGEDYELLFALPADQADRLIAEGPLAAGATRIGEIVAGSNVLLVDAEGRGQPLAGGWQHTG